MAKKTVLIVGGGTAGLLIASRLQDKFDVTVIERSKYDKYPKRYSIPLMIGLIFRSNILKYVHKRDFILEDQRRIPFFESNVLGGASPINGCVHTVGCRSIWEKILLNFNASYDELISSYQEIYSESAANNFQINLRSAPQNEIDNKFASALNSYGLSASNMDFSDQEGYGPIKNTTGKIFRKSVLSLIKRRNFEVNLSETVRNLQFDDDGRVIGVETDKRSINSDFVIISAGVIGTCKLLLNQAIPDKVRQMLSEYGIGQEIQDHANLRVNVITKKKIGSLNEISQSTYAKFKILVTHLLGRSTLMAGTGATSGVHLDLDKDGIVDTRIHVLQFSETGRHGSDGTYFSKHPGFSLSITPITPKSRGWINVQNGEAVVNPNYFSDKTDVEIIKSALSYCTDLLGTDFFNDMVKEILNKQEIIASPEKYIKENFYSGHHLIGGCHHAVDKNFKVKNFDNLYICDASILSEYAASNIHSSVLLISNIFSRKFVEANF